MMKNIRLILILIILTTVFSAFFWYFNKNNVDLVDNGNIENNNTNNSEQNTNNQNQDQNNNQNNNENSQTEVSLSNLPQELKNLTFTDKYQKEAYENVLKAEDDIKKDAQNYDAYNAAGFNWKTLGDLTKKDIYYERAIEVYVFAGKYFENKKIFQPYQNAATVYTILKNYTKAEEMMKNAIALGPEVGELYIRLADLYQTYMNTPSQKIIDLYELAIHQESYQPDVIYPAYAQYLCSIGQEKQAEERTKLKCSSF